MKRRGVGENSPVIRFIGGLYKAIGFQIGELKARVGEESWKVVVYEKEKENDRKNR